MAIPKDLEAYMQGDGKRTGAKIVGGKQLLVTTSR